MKRNMVNYGMIQKVFRKYDLLSKLIEKSKSKDKPIVFINSKSK